MMRRILTVCSLLLVFAWQLPGAFAESDAAVSDDSDAHIAQLTVDGAIGPATTDYLVKSMAEAREQGAQAILIRMDTPGGLDAATRDIIKEILASPIPIITYVHPSGARAASAGTYILYASHIAAMTPATSLGAATPVDMSGKGPGPNPQAPDSQNQDTGDDSEQDEDTTEAPSGTAMERKVVNDAVAFIRGLANRHNRNADWAEKAVREAVSLTAEEAKEQNVVDIVAIDVEDLLAQAEGREVQMRAGSASLKLAGLAVKEYEPNWRNRLLALITNPQIAYILLLIGIYGLIFEGYSPGAMVPGVVGVICLLLAFYALQVLPINYAGLALIIVGALLIASEAFVPSFGVLGIGGVVALVIGSVLLIDTEVPEMMVSRELIGAIGAVSALIVLGVLVMVGRSLRIPRFATTQEMVGRIGYVVHSDGQDGQVRINGELWRATSSKNPLSEGQRVRVVEQHGLSLTVEQEESHD